MKSELLFLDQLPLWANWEAQLKDSSVVESIEFILYGRAWITGLEGQFGPYLATNAMSGLAPQSPPGPQPVVAVRADLHKLGGTNLDRTLQLTKRFGTDAYHGGTLLDEVAALVALVLGSRIKAGPIVRRFDASTPLGRPQFLQGLRAPYLPERTDGRCVITNTQPAVGIQEVDQLALTINLGNDDRRALMKAARYYQNALWIAEEDTATAWLYLVSAIETIAHRVKIAESDPVSLLKQSHPELVNKLEELHAATVTLVADTFGTTLKVTKGFRETVRRFLPDPPPIRPPSYGQIDWDWEKLRKGIDQIYKLRSKAVHEGIPFPGPLCEPPVPTTDEHGKLGTPQELPPGDSWVGISGWKATDMPMYIHVFAHITRGVLLNWMRATAEGSAGPAIRADVQI
jgi:hypothetical protein